MRSALFTLIVVPLTACSVRTETEDWQDWYDPGSDYEVTEPLEFTDQPYGLPAAGGTGIGDLVSEAFEFDRGYGTALAAAEYADTEADCSNWFASDVLPMQVTGVVTVHPRFYFKTNGCTTDDEKYYGSYFIEDDTGGVFVLGDSKVAHFDMGDTVTLNVRATRRSFGLNMVYVHEVTNVERTARPISYEIKQAPFGDEDIGEVRRVTGTVVRSADNFGEILVQPDGHDGTCDPDDVSTCVVLGLDIELSRRGISFEVGESITVTGPILFSYDAYSLILTRVGQITRHE